MSSALANSSPEFNGPHLQLVPTLVEQPNNYDELARAAVLRIEAEGTLAEAVFRAKDSLRAKSAAQLALAASLEYPSNTKGLGL